MRLPRWAAWLRAIPALGSSLALALLTSAAGSGPSVPFVVERLEHPAATPGLDAGRTGHTSTRLPKELALAWRSHVPFGIAAMAVAAGGHPVVVSHGAQLLELGPRGEPRWTRELSAAPTSSVNLLPSGLRLIATSRGVVEAFDADGHRRFEVDPGWSRPDASTQLLPLADGSFVAGNQRQLCWFEADGAPRAATELGEPLQSLAWTGRWVVAVARSGTAWSWSGREAARQAGSFGDDLRSTPLALSGKLLALTRTGLRELDPATGRAHFWLGGLDLTEPTPLVLSNRGTLAWLDRDNGLERANASGRIDKQPLGPETTSFAASLPPIGDDSGTLALLNALGELTLVDAKHQVTTDGEVRCGEPVALLPQRPGRLLLACASGSIWAFGR